MLIEFEKFDRDLKKFKKELEQFEKKIKDENSLIKINESVENCWDENKYNTIKIYDKDEKLSLPSKKNLKLSDLGDTFQIIKEKLVSACRVILNKSESHFYEFTVYNFQNPLRRVVKRVEGIIIFLEELMDVINP